MIENEDNVNEAYNTFHTKLMGIVDNHMPMKKRKTTQTSAFQEHATTKKSNIQKTNVTQQIFTLKIKEKLGNISPTKKFCKQTETTIYQKLFCRALHWWSKTKRFLANNQTLFNKQG